MLKNIFFLILVSVLFAACSQDEDQVSPESDMTLKFTSHFGPNLLVLGEVYNYLDYRAKFDKFKFILTNLELVSDGDEVVQLSDVELIDFKNAFTESEAAKGVVLDFDGIPTGTYKAIRFTIGLDTGYLGMTPGDFSSDDVLAQSEMYWASWGNYIITKLEARFDANNDDNFLDETFEYHLGGDPAYRTVEKNIDLTLIIDGSSVLELDVDVRDLLTLESALVDPAEYSGTHSLGSEVFIGDLLDSFKDAFENN